MNEHTDHRQPSSPLSPLPAAPADFEKDMEQELAKSAGMSEPPAGGPVSELRADLEQVKRQLDLLVASFSGLRDQIAAMAQEAQKAPSGDSLLTEMHQQCRAAGEQFFKTAVLEPMCLRLIGVADRCRQQAEKLQGILDKNSGREDNAAIRAIRYVLEARNADRIEVEALLADYGVEPFQSPEGTFDPSTQKVVSRQECQDASLQGRVAQRLLPGYRRNDKILRREYVSVHVAAISQTQGESR